MMTCINVAEFVLINGLEKDRSTIETRRFKNVAIFIQTFLFDFLNSIRFAKCLKQMSCNS